MDQFWMEITALSGSDFDGIQQISSDQVESPRVCWWPVGLSQTVAPLGFSALVLWSLIWEGHRAAIRFLSMR